MTQRAGYVHQSDCRRAMRIQFSLYYFIRATFNDKLSLLSVISFIVSVFVVRVSLFSLFSGLAAIL